MNRNSLAFCLMLFMGAFLSCSKTQDECYSCNEKIDSFVKSNQKSLKKLDLFGFLSYEKEIQKATYRMLPADRKQQLWLSKYESLLFGTSKFSKDELAAIQKLHDFVSANSFQDSTESHKDKIHAFGNNWIMETQAKFGWDVMRYKYLLLSLDTDEGSFIANNTSTPQLMDSNEAFCKCNEKNGGILIKDCLDGYDCTSSEECAKKPDGCGYFWADPCDGDCELKV